MSDQDRKRTRGKPPISRHPLFPATVALWFGALFGLGSLAIRPAVLDSLAQSLHLGLLGAAFEPPVDTSGRVLIVLAIAAIGALLGLLMARRIAGPTAAPSPVQPEEQRPELAEPGNALWSELKSRRRALAEDQDKPVDDAPKATPVFDREPQIFDLASVGIGGFADEPAEAEAPAQDEIGGDAFEPLDWSEADEPASDEIPDDQTAFEPLHWSAASEPAAEEFEIEPTEPETAPADEDEAFPLPEETAAERIASADLDALSHVELLERLALSLQRRSQQAASLADDTPADEPVTCEASPAFEPADELTQVHAALEPHDVVSHGHRDEAVIATDAAAIPEAEAGPTAPLAPVAADDGGDDIEDEALAEGYSSLLQLGRPTSLRPFVRVQAPEDAASEPAVVFPGQAERRSAHRAAVSAASDPVPGPGYRPLDAPASAEALLQDPAETEKALRAALAALQRMSGAA